MDNREFTTLREAVLDGEESVFSTDFAFHFYLWRRYIAKAARGNRTPLTVTRLTADFPCFDADYSIGWSNVGSGL